jgi:chemotaxis protein MotB
MDGTNEALDAVGASAITPIKPISDDGAKNMQAKTQDEEKAARYRAAAAEVARLDALRRRIDAALRKHGLRQDVQMKIDANGLVVSLVSRHIVFAPNLANLTARGGKVLDVVAPVLADTPDKIDVNGHTNQVKVKPKYYATDWDLSSARAVTVLRYLNERRGIPGSRLSARAWGHEKPLVDPDIPGSQVVNKRVDVVVVSGVDEATRALFVDVLRDQGRL